MPPRAKNIGSLSSPGAHEHGWDSAEDWRGDSTRACEGRSDSQLDPGCFWLVDFPETFGL